jgi:tetratricopeptide (TPR) repeat protein
VALLASLVFANTLGNGFTLDDVPLVRDNPRIAELERIPELFTSEYWAHYEPDSGLYRPAVLASFALGRRLHGPEAWGYHLGNLLLHAANSVLVLLLYRRLTGHGTTALAAAGLFAVHAVHTEAVAPLSGRAELLCTFFFLVALLAHAGAGRSDRPLRAHVLSLGAFALALLSKETAITFLGVVLLQDAVQTDAEAPPRPATRRGRRPAHYAVPYVGFLAVAGLYLAVRFLWLDVAAPGATTTRLDNPLLHLEMPWSRINALLVAHRYLGLLVLPVHLAYDYSLAQIRLIEDLSDPRAWLVLAGGILVVCIWVRSWRWSRPLFFALGFGLITFSVVSNLVVGIGTIMAERLLYLPSVGFCLALVLGARLVAERGVACAPRRRRILAAGLVALLAFHAARTLDRNRDWADDATLMLHDLAVSPRSAKVRANAASVYIEQGRLDEAVAELRVATATFPEAARYHALLGNALLSLGREDEAIAAFEQAVARRTGEAWAWNNLGYLLVERGVDVERGIRLIAVAVELRPDEPAFLDSLGWAYFEVGRPEEALPLVARAVELEPNPTRREHLAAIQRVLAAQGAVP